MQTYNFTIDPFDSDRLSKEIKDSAIVTVLDNITALGNDVNIVFRAELSETDEGILNAIVAAHTGEALPSEVPVVKLDQPKDAEQAPLMRTKVTFSGWQFRVHGIEFKTCKPGSIVEEDENGTPFNFSTIKFYNAEGTELTEEAAIQNAETGAVKTVLDWEPTHDIELIGGRGKQLVKPSAPVRVFVKAVPHVPAPQGSKLFLSCINLQYLGVDSAVVSDGRVPKLLTYNAIYHTNLLRFTIKHPPGLQHDLAFWMEFFKP